VIKKKDLDQNDKKAWEEYIKNPSDIYDKDKNYFKENQRKERFKYDLHGYTLEDANRKVKEIILSCKENKYKEILLITGKGLHSTNDKDIYVSKNLGTLRYSVPEFIKSNEELNNFIISIKEADIKDGGEGALLIKLKNL
jgi:DNA-nicking Smr family endonuclease